MALESDLVVREPLMTSALRPLLVAGVPSGPTAPLKASLGCTRDRAAAGAMFETERIALWR